MWSKLHRIWRWIWSVFQRFFLRFFRRSSLPPPPPPPPPPLFLSTETAAVSEADGGAVEICAKNASEADKELPMLFSILPIEIWDEIFQYLDAPSMASLGRSCLQGKEIVSILATNLSGEMTAPDLAPHFVGAKTFQSENIPEVFDSSLADLHLLTHISLYDCGKITDAAFGRLSLLEELNLVGNSGVSGETLVGDYLRVLNLTRNWSFNGRNLARFTRLEDLNLAVSDSCSSEDLSHVATSLTSLNLSENEKVSNGGFLHRLTNLKRLDLMNNRMIVDQDLASLHLEWLNLRSNICITGDCLDESVESLRWLGLRNNYLFSNTNLEYFTNLQELDLTRNTRIDRNWFAENRPNLRIIWNRFA